MELIINHPGFTIKANSVYRSGQAVIFYKRVDLLKSMTIRLPRGRRGRGEEREAVGLTCVSMSNDRDDRL